MQFTPENKAAFDRIVSRYPVKRSALLPALHLVQDQEGYISSEAIEYLASLLELTPAQVHDTATFYTMYRFRPEGRHHIEVCTNLSCALAGADELIAHACATAGHRGGRHHRRRRVHRAPRGVPGRLRRRHRGAGGRRLGGVRAADDVEAIVSRRPPRAPVRLAEERGGDDPAAQRLQGGLGLARRPTRRAAATRS